MSNSYIFAEGAPEAVGPYSHAVKSGSLLYTSGQLGLDPRTGGLADGVEAQAQLALSNLKAVLAAADMDMSDVIKTTVFLTNMDDFAAINGIYAEAFGDSKPARSCVAVAALPKGAAFEVEAVACKG
ncbi:Rid family detoxifying hydrolase [Eubacteriales bacterium OttesenSCG-928-A19]|nr:Rid family detoxifying hydrolase [Eubacteriales bacterium OttesenSCG-928-A19]